MRLEIGNFYVKDIKFGDKLSFDDGVLTINKEKALDFIREDERITEADLYIAKPGDKIRMCPVKEAIEPRVRLDGRGLFPGYTSAAVKLANHRSTKPAYDKQETSQLDPALLIVSPFAAPS